MKIISIENRELRYGKYQKKMVIDVDGKIADVYFSSRAYNRTWRERKRKSRLSVYGTAVETWAEDFVNRTRRPYKVYREAAKPFLEALGLPTKGIVWNQYAYCSCPCSPAFIMPIPITRNVAVIGGKEYSKRGFHLSDIVDIEIYIREELPMVDESKDMDLNRVDALGNLFPAPELAGV